ncbi:hypothetical protein NDU88_003304 [Pleurodeles waltl]|uniref:Uncharacterized protein n=1 Tax=Pleurodeles waltl TaxID=8319 RepID=A0AAV7LI72_PLEWA|nr:hypothetical protein NDU88_003304 [Pleurodeles waltl]
MPGSRSSTKISSKLERQLLFSEALLHSKASPPAPVTHQPAQHHTMSDPAQESTMDLILQEISAVGRRLEGMDNTIASLMAETKSIRLDIAGFQSRVLGLEQWVSLVETHVASTRDRDQELLYLCSKLTDLEDRSRRDNVRFLGFPETIEGEDMHSYLRETLPKLTDIAFDPTPRVSESTQPRSQETRHNRSSPANHGLLPPTRKLVRLYKEHLSTHGPCLWGGQEIWITADFSKETSTHRRAVLALRPRLCQKEVKFGLFELARMWVTKTGVSQNYYEPEDLRSFLDSLQHMDTSVSLSPQDFHTTGQNVLPKDPPQGRWDQTGILQFLLPENGMWNVS